MKKGRHDFVCSNCGCLNKVEPVYDRVAEEKSQSAWHKYQIALTKYDAQCERFDELTRKCQAATTAWKATDKWAKLSNLLTFGLTFKRFIDGYPELHELRERGSVLYLDTIGKVTTNYEAVPLPALSFPTIPQERRWNYSYTCENCGFVNKYWRE